MRPTTRRALLLGVGLTLATAVGAPAQTSDRPPVTYHEDPPPPGVQIGEPVAEERLPETSMAPMDNEPCKGGDCSGQQGDCRQVEENGYCSDDDLSPSFDKSPVDHSFNFNVCLPGATCHWEKESNAA